MNGLYWFEIAVKNEFCLKFLDTKTLNLTKIHAFENPFEFSCLTILIEYVIHYDTDHECKLPIQSSRLITSIERNIHFSLKIIHLASVNAFDVKMYEVITADSIHRRWMFYIESN